MNGPIAYFVHDIHICTYMYMYMLLGTYTYIQTFSKTVGEL